MENPQTRGRDGMKTQQPTLGALLRGLRSRNDWTLKEMSERTGIPVSTLSKVEHDRLTLTYDKLLQLSQRLNIRMSELFAETLFGSDQGDMYQDMFDDQMAMQLSKGKGLGLADMLIRQLAGVAAQGSQPGLPPQSAGGESGKLQGAALISPAAHAAGQAASVNDASSTSHSRLSAVKDDFIRTMRPHAEQAAREIGVDADALLAQAALETGWGRSVPCTAQGECSFNLFGIKAGGRWSGATVSVPTLEFESGVPVRKAERFRAYESAAHSFRDYAALIRDSARYQDALGAGSNVEAFASALQQGGYATDPRYAEKVGAIAHEVRARTDALKFAAAGPLPANRGARL